MRVEQIVFLQSEDERDEWESIMDRDGIIALFRYLKWWHCPGEHEVFSRLSACSADATYVIEPVNMKQAEEIVLADPVAGQYVVTVNRAIGYCGLEYVEED